MDGGTTIGTPHRFTVADYHRMGEAGILGEDSRVELIRGHIVDMSPVGAPHVGFLNRLTRLLPVALAGRAMISVQNPLRLDNGSEPQPDLVVVKSRPDDYGLSLPHAADALLVIEVADSSLDYDRAVKAALYAESGIPEFWIVDVSGRTVEVHRRPANGQYADVRRVGADGILEMVAVPGAALGATELLRPFS